MVHRLEKQQSAFESFDLSLKSCEKTIGDLDWESLQKFSAVGSNGGELKNQVDDITVSELLPKFRSSVDVFFSTLLVLTRSSLSSLCNPDKERLGYTIVRNYV